MLTFQLLGRPQITLDDRPVTDFASEKELLLLCYLACNPGQHGRGQIAGLLWAEMSEERARANLSTAVYNLRQLLPEAIEASRKTVGLNPAQPVWLDTAALQQAAGDDGRPMGSTAALYRGLFLEGIYPQDAPELEAWLQQERERWRLLALTVLDRLAHDQTRAGQWDEAIATLRRLLDLEPWREESHRLLMRLLAGRGHYNAALVQYDTCRALLQEELGVEPMAATTAVYERVRAARQRPEPGNLPAQPTPLVGRAAELGRLFLWLHDPEQRLVTLAGPGGSGKTRLAVAAAAASGYAFLDGLCFVPLAEAGNAAAVIQAISTALGLTLTAGQELAGQNLAQLLDFLRAKEMLLVLDNVEQALAPTADLIVALLETAPRLRLLVTSREYLQLRWETRLPLDGLPAPPAAAGDPAEFDAVRLFLQVARRVRPDFHLAGQDPFAEAVAALCRLVEGLPLAIELAAALVDSQSPDQLLAQVEQGFDRLAATMRDVPGRHRSLRAVFDYSWTLLTPAQQAALARLALFHGGFTIPAAAAAAQAERPLLDELVAKSLVRPDAGGDGRYSLHEVIRQYALERVDDRERAAGDHAAYFIAQVERATAALRGPEQTSAGRQLLADLANIEAAWNTAVAGGQVDPLLRMAPGLARLYQVAGLYQSGAAAFAAARAGLPAPVPALPVYHAVFLLEQHEYADVTAAVDAALAAGLSEPPLLAQAYIVRAVADLRRGRSEEAGRTAAQALAAAEAAQTPWLQAQAFRALGELAEQTGDYDQAEQAIRQALARYEASGDPAGLANTYQALAVVVFRRGDMGAARELLEKALAVQRQVDPSGLSSARVLVRLATVLANLGQEAASRHYYREALAVFQQTGDRSGAALASDMLGETAAVNYDFAEARAYLEQAVALRREIGQPKGIANARRHLADLALRLGAYAEARQVLAEVLESYRAIQERRSEGTTLARLALANSYLGDFDTAVQQAEAALVVAEEIGNSLVRAYALSSLGHARRGQKAWEPAAAAYAAAIPLWQEWDSDGLAAEIQAALAAVHLAAGRSADAWPLLEAAVTCLAANPQPDCDNLGQLYLDCVLLLQAKGEGERAADLRRQAADTVTRLAGRIADDEARATFLTAIPAHRRLLGR